MSAAISSLPQTTVKFLSKSRKVDFEGFEVADDKSLSFRAGVIPQGSKDKKGDRDGTVGVDDNNIFACGRVDVQLDDELEFCNQKGKVISVVFWGLGNFTHIIARTVTRKRVTRG